MQTTLTFLLVLACAVYASWVLMPRALQRGLAQRLLQLPWPDRLSAFWQRAAKDTPDCTCHGCEQSSAGPSTQQSAPQAVWQPVRLPPRQQRGRPFNGKT